MSDPETVTYEGTWSSGPSTLSFAGLLATALQGCATSIISGETEGDTVTADCLILLDGEMANQAESIPPRQLSVTVGGTQLNTRLATTTRGSHIVRARSTYKGITRKIRDTAFQVLQEGLDTLAAEWGCDAITIKAGPAAPEDGTDMFIADIIITWTRRHSITTTPLGD
jgi:hypothetical protein